LLHYTNNPTGALHLVDDFLLIRSTSAPRRARPGRPHRTVFRDLHLRAVWRKSMQLHRNQYRPIHHSLACCGREPIPRVRKV